MLITRYQIRGNIFPFFGLMQLVELIVYISHDTIHNIVSFGELRGAIYRIPMFCGWI